MQELIENLDGEMKSRGMLPNWDMYLEKEKEQIKDAFEIGISEGLSMENNTLGYDANPEEYYNQTYNNEKD